MAITTLSMVLTVFVLNLHHVSDRPVPRWAKKVSPKVTPKVTRHLRSTSRSN